MNYLKIANILLGGALLLGGCAKSPDAPDAKRDEALKGLDQDPGGR